MPPHPLTALQAATQPNQGANCDTYTHLHTCTHTEASEEAATLVVSVEIHLDDMEFDEDSDLYWARCRCGDRYEVNEEQLDSGDTIVGCQSCSLRAKIIDS